MNPTDSGKSRVGSLVIARSRYDPVVEEGQLHRQLDEPLEQEVLLERQPEGPHREVLYRHVGVEVEDGGGLARHAAAADEPLLQVEPLGQRLDQRVEVEDLDAAEIDPLPIRIEVEGGGIDALRKRLDVRQPEDDVLGGDDDASRADLAVGQVEIAGRLQPQPVSVLMATAARKLSCVADLVGSGSKPLLRSPASFGRIGGRSSGSKRRPTSTSGRTSS